MFGNENDRPYVFKASLEGVSAMSAVVQAAKAILKVPFGVNYLWDPNASVAIGAATGASFVREIFTGVFASDMGIWEPDCASASRLRRNLGREDMKLLLTSTPNSPILWMRAPSNCARSAISRHWQMPFWCPGRSPVNRLNILICAKSAKR
jgi:predicted TIM-barrel enzyme